MEARRRAQRRSRRIRRVLTVVLLGGVVFAAGIALGRAIDEGPQDIGPVTRVRTLRPLPVAPIRETVTVTVRR